MVVHPCMSSLLPSPVPQEAVKINQGTGIWVEDCNFGYGWNAAFDCSEWRGCGAELPSRYFLPMESCLELVGQAHAARSSNRYPALRTVPHKTCTCRPLLRSGVPVRPPAEQPVPPRRLLRLCQGRLR